MRLLLFTLLILLSNLGMAQTSDEKVRDEIFQRAEAFYSNEQYAQAADLLDRLSVLKIPYDFKSIYLKIKALSNVYNTSEKYFGMMDASIDNFEGVPKGSDMNSKVAEVAEIKQVFLLYKKSEEVAYEKAKNGSLKDKEDYLEKFPNSLNAEEIRNTKSDSQIIERELKIKELENGIIKLKEDLKKASKPNSFSIVITSVGVPALVFGIIGFATYAEDSDWNFFKDKNTAIVVGGTGIGLIGVGMGIGIPAANKRAKIKSRILENEKLISTERKKVVWVSPYSKSEFGTTLGIRVGMKF